jgi:hypothetical protein
MRENSTLLSRTHFFGWNPSDGQYAVMAVSFWFERKLVYNQLMLFEIAIYLSAHSMC